MMIWWPAAAAAGSECLFIDKSIRVHPPSAGAGLALAVEVDGGDGRAEVVELGEVPGVEVLAPPGGVHRLPPQLLEQHEHEAVDPHRRPRVLVAHHLLTCMRPPSISKINVYVYLCSPTSVNINACCEDIDRYLCCAILIVRQRQQRVRTD